MKMSISVNSENFTSSDTGIWRTLIGPYGFALGCGSTGTRVMRISATEYRVDAGPQSGQPFFDSGFVYAAAVSTRLAAPTSANAHFAYSGPTDGVLLYVYLEMDAGFMVTVF